MTRCAQQTAVTGGEKDTAAPMIDTLKLTSPMNGSTSFSASSISINFNELVVLKNADKQIIITPFLDTKPDIYTKGKKVIVDFKEPLALNTTYIVNFGDAIVDITEGNVFKNYKYVFSTGTYIDSLTYNAFVFNSETKKPEKDVLVMLYKENEDSVVSKIKPNYFGKTNVAGICEIQNIAAGEYKVVALKDENGNYKFDPKEELIGAVGDLFNADKDTLQDTIGVFLNRPSSFEIIASTVNANGKGTIILNKQLHKDSVAFIDSVRTVFINGEYSISDSRDTINYWINPDTVEENKYPMIVGGCKKFNTFLKQPTDTILKFRTNSSVNLKPQEDLYFEFFQPIETINKGKIKLYQDSLEMPFEIIQTSLSKIVFAADFQPDLQYQIELLPSALTSFYKVTNDTVNAMFEKNDANSYGNILLTIDAKVGESFILELASRDKTIKSLRLTAAELKSVNFNNLSSGTYRLKLIYDNNSNGVWDSGDYYEHINPERVEFYSEVIDLKKGWDMDISWTIK